MKIYDISQELTGCSVYPGDPAPRLEAVRRMSEGSLYNLSLLSMCVHNGTHVDAPFHFVAEGRTVEQIPLDYTVGLCYVAEHDGFMTASDASEMLRRAKTPTHDSARRILIRGASIVTAEAARVFAESGLYLLGVESQSVGPIEAPAEVHLILLGRETVLLEGIRLTEVREGHYFLFAAPISLQGSDGSPCRAVLVDFD